MLRPSYSELMDQLNSDVDLDTKIVSRYTIVIAAAKRARQIINGAPCYSRGASTDKAVSVAINEMKSGRIKILPYGFNADNSNDYDSSMERKFMYVDENIAQPSGFVDEDFDDSIFDVDIDDRGFNNEQAAE